MIADPVCGTHNDVLAGGAGIGAELQSREAAASRRWQANRSKSKILLRFDTCETAKPGMTYPCLKSFSEAEAQPNRRIDHAPIEITVRQAAIDL
jgi:hypothetical protein